MPIRIQLSPPKAVATFTQKAAGRNAGGPLSAA
jgi:hypothetical protein